MNPAPRSAAAISKLDCLRILQQHFNPMQSMMASRITLISSKTIEYAISNNARQCQHTAACVQVSVTLYELDNLKIQFCQFDDGEHNGVVRNPNKATCAMRVRCAIRQPRSHKWPITQRVLLSFCLDAFDDGE